MTFIILCLLTVAVVFLTGYISAVNSYRVKDDQQLGRYIKDLEDRVTALEEK